MNELKMNEGFVVIALGPNWATTYNDKFPLYDDFCRAEYVIEVSKATSTCTFLKNRYGLPATIKVAP